MARPTDDVIAKRVSEIAKGVRDAHEAFDDGKAKHCGFLARHALEEMLLVWCWLNDVDVGRGKDEGQLATLRQRLVHAKVISKRTDKHVGVVHHLGNEAVHPPGDDEERFELDDARSLLASLDAVWKAFRGRLPREVARAAHVSRGFGWLGIAAMGVGVVVTPVVSFLVVWTALGGSIGRAPHSEPVPQVVSLASTGTVLPSTPSDQPVAVPDFGVAAEPLAVEATSGGDPMGSNRLRPPVTPTALEPARQGVVYQVQRGELLVASELEGVDCRRMTWARDWIWARHGYKFTSTEARQFFAEKEAYHAGPGRLAAIEREFTDEDWMNLRLLNKTMERAHCECPKPGKSSIPCPE